MERSMANRAEGDRVLAREMDVAQNWSVGTIVGCWLVYFATMLLPERLDGVVGSRPVWAWVGFIACGGGLIGGLLFRWLRREALLAGQGHLIALGKDRKAGWLVLGIGLMMGLLPWTMSLLFVSDYATVALDRSDGRIERRPVTWSRGNARSGSRCSVSFTARGAAFSRRVGCDGKDSKTAIVVTSHPGALGVPWIEKNWTLE